MARQLKQYSLFGDAIEQDENKKTKKKPVKMTEEEKKEFDELYQYVRIELLGYKDNNKLMKQSILRLKGLKNGQYMVNRSNSIEFPCDYSYKSWLVTFKAVSQKIKYGLQHNTFTDELHQINYMIKIAESKINEICLAMQRAEKQKQLNEEMAKTLDSMEEIQKRQEFYESVWENRKQQEQERKPDFVQEKYKHLW